MTMYNNGEILGFYNEPPLWKSAKKPMTKKQRKNRKRSIAARKSNVQRQIRAKKK